jgi:hypothetical protein
VLFMEMRVMAPTDVSVTSVAMPLSSAAPEAG